MDLWFSATIFPGMLFFLALSIIIEHVNSRLYERLSFKENATPMFIPLIHNFKILTQKTGRKKLTARTIIQTALLLVLLLIPVIAFLFLPINLIGKFPAKSGGYGRYRAVSKGIVGIFSFEGDALLLFGFIVLFGVLVVCIQLLSSHKLRKEALKSYLQFAIWDIPLLFALGGFLLTKGSLSLSLLAQDIRLIVDSNRVFGFLILLPLATLVAFFSLAFKFDQPFFHSLPRQTTGKLYNPPLEQPWQLFIWNMAMRLMETLILGLVATICLAGPHLPIPEPANDYLTLIATSLNFAFKCILGGAIVSLIRAMQPRLRFDQVVNYSLKVLTPTSLFSLAIIGFYIALGQIY